MIDDTYLAGLVRPIEAERVIGVSIELLPGVHFFPYDDPRKVATKACRMATTQVAALGLKPAGFALEITINKRLLGLKWLERFADGLRATCEQTPLTYYQVNEDKNLHIKIHAFGENKGKTLSPYGANVGDWVCLSGTIGHQALGLAQRNANGSGFSQAIDENYMTPADNSNLGLALLHMASSCIAINCGLLPAVLQMADISGVAIELILSDIPTLLPYDDTLIAKDEVALLFTVPPDRCHTLSMISTPLAVIGEVKRKL